MVDATQNLTGTVASIKMPEVSAAPKVNISQGRTDQTASLGLGAPVNPSSSAGKPSVQIDSSAADVFAAIREQPAPIDIEAVERIREAVSTNNYPLDYSKIAEGLAEAFESLN
jgi:negative regulator of flagellin synthesis FlgM